METEENSEEDRIAIEGLKIDPIADGVKQELSDDETTILSECSSYDWIGVDTDEDTIFSDDSIVGGEVELVAVTAEVKLTKKEREKNKKKEIKKNERMKREAEKEEEVEKNPIVMEVESEKEEEKEVEVAPEEAPAPQAEVIVEKIEESPKNNVISEQPRVFKDQWNGKMVQKCIYNILPGKVATRLAMFVSMKFDGSKKYFKHDEVVKGIRKFNWNGLSFIDLNALEIDLKSLRELEGSAVFFDFTGALDFYTFAKIANTHTDGRIYDTKQNWLRVLAVNKCLEDDMGLLSMLVGYQFDRIARELKSCEVMEIGELKEDFVEIVERIRKEMSKQNCPTINKECTSFYKIKDDKKLVEAIRQLSFDKEDYHLAASFVTKINEKLQTMRSMLIKNALQKSREKLIDSVIYKIHIAIKIADELREIDKIGLTWKWKMEDLKHVPAVRAIKLKENMMFKKDLRLSIEVARKLKLVDGLDEYFKMDDLELQSYVNADEFIEFANNKCIGKLPFEIVSFNHPKFITPMAFAPILSPNYTMVVTASVLFEQILYVLCNELKVCYRLEHDKLDELTKYVANVCSLIKPDCKEMYCVDHKKVEEMLELARCCLSSHVDSNCQILDDIEEPIDPKDFKAILSNISNGSVFDSFQQMVAVVADIAEKSHSTFPKKTLEDSLFQASCRSLMFEYPELAIAYHNQKMCKCSGKLMFCSITLIEDEDLEFEIPTRCAVKYSTSIAEFHNRMRKMEVGRKEKMLVDGSWMKEVMEEVEQRKIMHAYDENMMKEEKLKTPITEVMKQTPDRDLLLEKFCDTLKRNIFNLTINMPNSRMMFDEFAEAVSFTLINTMTTEDEMMLNAIANSDDAGQLFYQFGKKMNKHLNCCMDEMVKYVAKKSVPVEWMRQVWRKNEAPATKKETEEKVVKLLTSNLSLTKEKDMLATRNKILDQKLNETEDYNSNMKKESCDLLDETILVETLIEIIESNKDELIAMSEGLKVENEELKEKDREWKMINQKSDDLCVTLKLQQEELSKRVEKSKEEENRLQVSFVRIDELNKLVRQVQQTGRAMVDKERQEKMELTQRLNQCLANTASLQFACQQESNRQTIQRKERFEKERRYEREVMELKEKLKSSALDNCKLVLESSRLQNEVIELNTRVQSTAMAIETLKDENKELLEKAVNDENLKMTINSLSSTSQRLVKENFELAESSKSSYDQVEKWEKAWKNEKAKRMALEALVSTNKEEVAILEEKLEYSQSEVEYYKKMVQEAENARMEAIVELDRIRKSRRDSMIETEEAMSILKEENARLQQFKKYDINQKSEDVAVEKWQTLNTDLLRDLDSLAFKYRTIKDKYSVLETQYMAADKERQKLYSDKQQLEIEILDMKKAHEFWIEEKEFVDKKLDDALVDAKVAKSELATKLIVIEVLEDDKRDLMAKNDDLVRFNRNWQKIVEAAVRDIRILNEDKKNLKEEVESLNKKMLKGYSYDTITKIRMTETSKIRISNMKCTEVTREDSHCKVVHKPVDKSRKGLNPKNVNV